jgi:hypothetical protein
MLSSRNKDCFNLFGKLRQLKRIVVEGEGDQVGHGVSQDVRLVEPGELFAVSGVGQLLLRRSSTLGKQTDRCARRFSPLKYQKSGRTTNRTRPYSY